MSALPGVSVTFERVTAFGEPPATLTVAADEGGTAANVRNFVDAYNTLQASLNELTRSSEDAKARGALANDAGVRALRTRLENMLRQDFDGVRLADIGIRADRDGNLTLDAARLKDKLAAMPDALDRAFGSTRVTAGSGVLGAMDSYLKNWLDSGSGQIKRRQDILQTQQKAFSFRQARLDDQFKLNYERYLMQFSQLQSLMGQMDQTAGLFAQQGALR